MLNYTAISIRDGKMLTAGDPVLYINREEEVNPINLTVVLSKTTNDNLVFACLYQIVSL